MTYLETIIVGIVLTALICIIPIMYIYQHYVYLSTHRGTVMSLEENDPLGFGYIYYECKRGHHYSEFKGKPDPGCERCRLDDINSDAMAEIIANKVVEKLAVELAMQVNKKERETDV